MFEEPCARTKYLLGGSFGMRLGQESEKRIKMQGATLLTRVTSGVITESEKIS